MWFSFRAAKLGNNGQVIDQSHRAYIGSDAKRSCVLLRKRIKNFKCFGMQQGEVFQFTSWSSGKGCSSVGLDLFPGFSGQQTFLCLAELLVQKQCLLTLFWIEAHVS